jgi:hypothetical protein
MDDLARGVKAKPDQRDAQFLRLRDRIEQRASRKFEAREFEGTPPGIITVFCGAERERCRRSFA